MDFFVLEMAPEYTAPEPLDWYGKLDSKTILQTSYSQMPEHQVFHIKEHMQLVFTDVILFPCFLVSYDAMKIIQLYEPKLRFKRVLLYSVKQKKSMAYYVPFLEVVDCLLDQKSTGIADRTKIGLKQINSEKIGDRALVRASNATETRVLVRLDLVESLLRRKMIGIGLREVNTIV